MNTHELKSVKLIVALKLILKLSSKFWQKTLSFYKEKKENNRIERKCSYLS